ncbi:MAG: beta-ketoacyl-[acyl-carrier-protein] synthase II, partial [Clostridiales bacterium]|nr:beta-ketoacyl-[acyl-carrier-protein] synthase II [Clostridiales bacterium]
MKRVVVTGLGNISPLGNGAHELWENIKNGKHGFNYITRFDTSSFPVKIAAEVKGFQPTDFMEKKLVKRYDLFTQFAVAASIQAFNDCGINIEKIDPYRFGVFFGSGIGGLTTKEEQIIKMHERGPHRVSPLFIPTAIINMAAGNIAIHLGAKGSSTAAVTACATGTNNIGDAYRSIKYGHHDIIITGGSEAAINKIGIAGFTSIMALSHADDLNRASIPFDKGRNGFVMGEGAGAIALEELNHALNRGAKIYAEICGYGSTCDAYHMTAPMPDGEGAAKAMSMAIEEAGIEKTDISYINSHGTSTQLNDLAETNAVKKAFGGYAYSL